MGLTMESKKPPSELLKRRLCHKYFAYGWSTKNITNILLLPLANKITPYDDKKILFVTNNTSVFFLRFQSHQQPFNNFKEHFQNPVEFIGNSKLKKYFI